MLDTVVLTLTSDQYQIIDPNKFTPPASWITRTHYHIQSKQNPTSKELALGIYKPRLSLATRFGKDHQSDLILKIELSLPKLMFGNNFQELQYKNFSGVVKKLIDVLHEMGVATTKDNITNATVSAIHYSKNIALTDGSTPYHYMSKLKEANMPLSLDVNQTDYRNDGHCLRWHCNSYEIIFYDKIRNLEQAKKSNKRAIEKDNELQLHLFDALQKRHMFEVLRMEVRLNKRQKVKQLFTALGIKADLTFKKLFKPAISKKVLLYYYEKLEQKRPLLHDYKQDNINALISDLIFYNPKITPRMLFCMLGLKKALEVKSARELRMLFPSYNQRSWQRMLSEAGKIQLPTIGSPFTVIRTQLQEFKALRDFYGTKKTIRKN